MQQLGDRAFNAAGPRIGNYLLMDLIQPDFLIKPFQTVAEEIFWSFGPKLSVNYSLTAL